jgi:DNA-binding NtrC family response regulator
MAEPVRIIVIDDDVAVRQRIKDLLTGAGYHVEIGVESALVMETLKGASYGCVLLDLRTEELEGTELLPIIKRDFPGMPVIVLSAFAGGIFDPKYLVSLGAFEVIHKPFDDALLVDTVKRAIGATETIPFVLTSLSLSKARNQLYRRLIVTALRKANWNQIRAASLLGTSRYTLMRWMRKLHIAF